MALLIGVICAPILVVVCFLASLGISVALNHLEKRIKK